MELTKVSIYFSLFFHDFSVQNGCKGTPMLMGLGGSVLVEEIPRNINKFYNFELFILSAILYKQQKFG